jgi:hypothetical protein
MHFLRKENGNYSYPLNPLSWRTELKFGGACKIRVVVCGSKV